MFKNVLAAAALTLGIATIATPSTAAPYNMLTEWNGFAEETATPVSLYNQNMDWKNIYSNRVSYSLTEWNGFAEETATPVPLYNQNMDWENIYR